jgi:phage protein D
VLSLSVTETSSQSDSFSIAVREHNPKPEAFAANSLEWIDSDVFVEGNEVLIEMGYQGNRSFTFLGRINGFNYTFPESGAPTLNVRGQSMYEMLKRSRLKPPFESQKDSDIVGKLADKLSLQIEVDPTDVEHALVSPIGASFAAILQERANRLNYDVTVKGRKLIFKRPTYLADPTPKMKLRWGRDLKSLSLETRTQDVLSRVEVRNTQTGQYGEKTALVGEAGAADVRSKLAKISAIEIAEKGYGKNELLSLDQRIATTAEGNQVSKAELERRAIGYASIRGSCIGNPRLVSRGVIEIEGIGERYSGKYYVTSTTHTIDANGYRTEFVAQSDGRNK